MNKEPVIMELSQVDVEVLESNQYRDTIRIVDGVVVKVIKHKSFENVNVYLSSYKENKQYLKKVDGISRCYEVIEDFEIAGNPVPKGTVFFETHPVTEAPVSEYKYVLSLAGGNYEGTPEDFALLYLVIQEISELYNM